MIPKHKKTRTLAFPAVAAALALGLAGCGAGGSPATSGDSLTVLVEGGGKAVLSPIAEAFETETGTSITFVELPYDSLFDRLSTELSTGNVSFDVAALDAIWLSNFGPSMESLDDLFTDAVKDDLFPSLIEEAQIDDRFIGMPAWTNAQILYYRTDLFSDADQQAAFSEEFGRDLTPPATWDEYMEVAEFFTQDSDDDGTIDLYGADVKGAVETEWLALVLQAGAESMVLDADGNVIINDAQHKAALDAYIAPLEAGFTASGSAQVDWATAQNYFNQGQTAMTRFWAHAYAQVPEDSPASGNVGVTTMPAGPGGEAAIPGAWYLSVPEATDNQEAATEFIQYVFDHNELGLDSDLGLAATVPALEAGNADNRPNLGALIEALEAPGSAARPATANWQEIVDAVLIPMLQKAAAGGADTQVLLDEAAEQIESIIN